MVKHDVKWMMIEGIDKDELAVLKFSIKASETELKWEHSGEFEYKGQMFDVVDTKISGDSVLYWCWIDHKETRLNQQLTKLVEDALHSNPQKKATQNRLTSFYNSLYCAAPFNFNITQEEHTQKLGADYSDSFTSIEIAPPVPPPKKA